MTPGNVKENAKEISTAVTKPLLTVLLILTAASIAVRRYGQHRYAHGYIDAIKYRSASAHQEPHENP